MSKKKKKKPEAEEAVDEEAPADELIEVPAADYEELQRKLQELADLNLRQRADFDNARKRLRKNVEEAGDRALARFIHPVLTELDHLALAIEHAEGELADKSREFADFAQGVGMICQNLVGILENAGIELIPTEGVFDPAVHEVIAEAPSDEPKGTIVHVQRTGYQLGGQVIRAAQVVVAKGPEEAAPTEAEAETETEAEEAEE